MSQKWVYLFREGSGDMRALLGGKGAGVSEMTNAGVPVPPGFTITTAACNEFYKLDREFPPEMWDQTLVALKELEQQTGKRFGDPDNPLIVSVRSGAPISMPGMMDTVLNLGLNQQTREGLANLTDNARFAHDAYRRFVQMFGRIVLGVPATAFEPIIERYTNHGKRAEIDLDMSELSRLADDLKAVIKVEKGVEFPEDPYAQLERAIAAVFNSWHGKRAGDYRRVNRIPDNLGTAVNVQAMVFGNMGNDSATGVAFTRDPNTGSAGTFGEYLVNAQGEDVVAGIRTPQPIVQLERDMPEVYGQFHEITQRLEGHYGDMQDIEFTIERGKLWLLQTRTGKRTGPAAVRIAVELVNEGKIDTATAVQRVPPAMLNQFLFPVVDAHAAEQATPLAKGLPASPGAENGRIVFDPDNAVAMAERGEPVILVRVETAPEDFHGMVVAKAILTARGGRTSHAAVVARGMGKCCVCGCDDLHIDYQAGTVTVGETVLKRGDYITVDGHSGLVYAGQIPTNDSEVLQVIRGNMAPESSALYQDFTTFLSWADEFRTLKVRANADTPTDALVGRKFGAEGIGLCRTEHMFFEGDRIDIMRQMILADTEEERRKALEGLEPLQQSDFTGIFTAMEGLPVTIRTLDPPLHEFLPHGESEMRILARHLGVSFEKVQHRIADMHETNPMLGFRGTRLGISYPEITEMQVRAIFHAVADVLKSGHDVLPEVMIPLVGFASELQLQEALVRQVAADVEAETGMKIPYLVGTMIELPRAALVADEIAHTAEFFSFGTNDLTQTTLGLSRDDARFLTTYVDQKVIEDDPFKTIDQRGVGQLVDVAIQRGRTTRPGMKIGVCGEHGGDPQSVTFFHQVGADYVSCSPYRVPIARLAAAQAALAARKQD